MKEISMLRQWLNEDRITDPKKRVTDEEILHWIQPLIDPGMNGFTGGDMN